MSPIYMTDTGAKLVITSVNRYWPSPKYSFSLSGLRFATGSAVARQDPALEGRTSSFAFRDTFKGVRQIGARLGVSSLLEGSVQRSGGRVRVSAQLVDAGNGFAPHETVAPSDVSCFSSVTACFRSHRLVCVETAWRAGCWCSR
jgi:hypothetical protein